MGTEWCMGVSAWHTRTFDGHSGHSSSTSVARCQGQFARIASSLTHVSTIGHGVGRLSPRSTRSESPDSGACSHTKADGYDRGPSVVADQVDTPLQPDVDVRCTEQYRCASVPMDKQTTVVSPVADHRRVSSDVAGQVHTRTPRSCMT
jgi:hypothetical protein